MPACTGPQGLITEASARFQSVFGAESTTVTFAPGRVELLGNHTDYNDGLVLAAAIDRFTVVVGRLIDEPVAEIHAMAFGATDRVNLAGCEIEPGPEGDWRRYTRGVLWAMRDQWPQGKGLRAVVLGNVPLGAGLSSSASVQVALGLFLLQASGLKLADDEARMALARRLRRAENGFVGVASGLLDFVSVLLGEPGKAVYLDCRSLEVKKVSLGQPPPAIVVMDSGTSRRLADGMYNIRRSECERVVDHFRRLKSVAEVLSLRDISPEELSQQWKYLDPVGRMRARHVLIENQRVREGFAALERGELEEFGHLVSRSHRSSMTDFQNSSAALDQLVAAALASPGCLGAKLSGAGWAGCVVAVVRQDQAEAFQKECTARYHQATGHRAVVYLAESAGCSG
ncbi:MAG: galactokinase [Isosphaeraceae bacterium]